MSDTPLEVCCGCDAEAEEHPFVAVRLVGDEGVADPVCRPCWQDPSHRKRIIKATFFARESAEVGRRLAGLAAMPGQSVQMPG